MAGQCLQRRRLLLSVPSLAFSKTLRGNPELIINWSSSCLILFIVNHFRASRHPSSLWRETFNTLDQHIIIWWKLVKVTAGQLRNESWVHCVLWDPALSHPQENQAHAVGASQHGACIFQNVQFEETRAPSVAEGLMGALHFWSGGHPYLTSCWLFGSHVTLFSSKDKSRHAASVGWAQTYFWSCELT